MKQPEPYLPVTWRPRSAQHLPFSFMLSFKGFSAESLLVHDFVFSFTLPRIYQESFLEFSFFYLYSLWYLKGILVITQPYLAISIPPLFSFFPSLQPDSLPSESPGRPIYLSAAAKSLQLGPTLCDPIDGSPPGSSIPGILQARTLEYPSSFIAWKIKTYLPRFPVRCCCVLNVWVLLKIHVLKC